MRFRSCLFFYFIEDTSLSPPILLYLCLTSPLLYGSYREGSGFPNATIKGEKMGRQGRSRQGGISSFSLGRGRRVSPRGRIAEGKPSLCHFRVAYSKVPSFESLARGPLQSFLVREQSIPSPLIKIKTVSKMHCFILQVLIFLTVWSVGCCIASLCQLVLLAIFRVWTDRQVGGGGSDPVDKV